MKLRTMIELERDINAGQLERRAELCAMAIEIGRASDAASFAMGAVRAARRLELSQRAVEAEMQAEPTLRLVRQFQVADREFADEPVVCADFKADRVSDFCERIAA